MRGLYGVSLAGVLVFASGCSAPTPTVHEPHEKVNEAPLTTSRVLPLQDRYVASFRSLSVAGVSSFVLEYFRPSPNVAELLIAGRRQELRVEEGAVRQSSGGLLLQDPLEVGRAFRGSFGDVTVEQVDVAVTVPAGTFAHCVVTRETKLEPPKSAVSTYCAEVGLVRLTVEAWGERLDSELMSYGPRVDLGAAP